MSRSFCGKTTLTTGISLCWLFTSYHWDSTLGKDFVLLQDQIVKGIFRLIAKYDIFYVECLIKLFVHGAEEENINIFTLKCHLKSYGHLSP